MKKAALHNLGCKVNAYETEAMTQLLKENGYEIVPFSDKADVYIVNTCSVTNIADRKSRQMLHKAKVNNPDAVVVATGCYVQTAMEKIKEDSAIDIVIGNNKKKDIVQILDNYFNTRENTHVIDINDTDVYEDLEIATVTEHTRAHIKIQDGCNNFCTYCIIPYARGRIRSRKMDNIKKEIERLAQNGFCEVVFTGINLGFYKDGDNTLIDVIEMADKIHGIKRIRLGSIDPEVVTEEFIDRLRKVKNICPHFHLSLQSGCDDILKAMNRHYTTEEYLQKCAMIRNAFDKPAVTTDIIVGFPGESKKNFEDTVEFAKKAELAQLHVFKYSRRNGTAAAKMPNQVSEEEKSKRSETLIQVGNKLTEQYRKNFIGKKKKILIEEIKTINGKEYSIGHTTDYIPVAVENVKEIAGKVIEAEIKDFINHEIMLATR